MTMRPRIHIITLGVEDLERSLRFYRDGLGLETPGIVGTEYPGDDRTPAGDVVMFRLDADLILALYPRSELAKDAGVPLAPGTSAFSLAHMVGSRDEVDALLAQAEAAGATVTDPPHDRPWGMYSGYFRDPDGHLWEVIENREKQAEA